MMNRAQITVTEPNGVRRSRPLPPHGLTIGRGSNNDLVIAYEFASRNHAQVTFDGQNYYVVDLNSANGTYLGNNRLAPHVPAVWLPNQPLRIGNVLIHIEQQAPVYSGPPAGGQVPMNPAQPRESTETMAGWKPKSAQSQGSSSTTLIIWLGLGLLCLCAILAAVTYYLFFL